MEAQEKLQLLLVVNYKPQDFQRWASVGTICLGKNNRKLVVKQECEQD